MMKILLFLLAFTLTVYPLVAEAGYFMSLKSNEVNLRIGPGTGYPVKFTYIKSKVPVYVIEELGAWKKVKDVDGDEGWINSKLLSQNVYVISTHETAGYKYPNITAKQLVKIEKFAIIKLIKTDKDWILVKNNNKTFWVRELDFWGIL